MPSVTSNGFMNCSWHDIEYCVEPKESDFQRLNKLGGGTYGDVFRVRHRFTGQIYALKQIRDEHEVNGISATAMREASILKQLNHPNIIQLEDIFLTDDRCYFLLEYMDEDLKRYLDRNRPLERTIVQSFMYQLFDAICYCHQSRIIHRDIKPHNILVNGDGQVKLCDFGLARAFTVPLKIYTHEIVTLWYRAPEILLGSASYGTPVDVWSLGCIFGELYQGWSMFHGDSEIDQIFQIFKMMGTPTEDSWPNIIYLPQFKTLFPKFKMQKEQLQLMMDCDPVAYDLLKGLLTCDPTLRLSARHALSHNYFTSYHRDDFDENNNLIPKKKKSVF